MTRNILIAIIVISVVGTSCSKKDIEEENIPRISTPAQRQQIILNELKKQTVILEEIKTRLANQEIDRN